MDEFKVGDHINETALTEYTVSLRNAYKNGALSGGSMDWSDIQRAYNKAIEAFGDVGLAFARSAEEGFQIEPRVTFPSDASWEVRSAAQLLFAYRYPNDVLWEEVDTAWEVLLEGDVERGTKPMQM